MQRTGWSLLQHICKFLLLLSKSRTLRCKRVLRLNEDRMSAVFLLMQHLRVAGTIAWLACAAFGQEQPTTFDVATIKPSKATGGMNNLRDPVQATWTNMPLAVLIRSAYHLQPDQLVVGSSWISSDRWDIIAKSEKPATREQQDKMLQPILADRFKLKVHWQTRTLPQYELVVGRGGPKLHKVQEGDPDARPASTRIGKGLIDAHGIASAEFAGWLRSELGRPVVDRTGLTGKYDFKLQWEADESQPNSGGDAPPPDATGPSIFAAIRQLGLKLNAIKGQVEVLVIDHAEKPSEN
jgi:uncharacterized protein (TIGR03435 family)